MTEEIPKPASNRARILRQAYGVVIGSSGETKPQQFIRRVFDYIQWVIVTAAVSAFAAKSGDTTLGALSGLLKGLLSLYILLDLNKRTPFIGSVAEFAQQGRPTPWWYWVEICAYSAIPVFVGSKLFGVVEAVLAGLLKSQ